MSESEQQHGKQSVRLKVSARLAGIAKGLCGAEERLLAIRGQSDLNDAERLTLLICLSRSRSKELAGEVNRALETFPGEELRQLASDPSLQPGLLGYLARNLASRHGLETLLLANPALPEAFRPHLESSLAREEKGAAADQERTTGSDLAEDEASEGAEDSEELEEGEDPENQSKYQMTLHMGVADKVKAALTGDKEWRKLLINDPNKLVSAAVLKNPRISEGEVYAVARNKSANEELIRLILLNKDWLKNYSIKLALVMHPRTPLAQALRFMGVLTEKDLTSLAKSREISRVISNNARRILMNKNKRR